MSDLPGDLLFTKDHEWLRREEDGSVTIGITDHAQSALGDLVYVELPEVGQDVEDGGEMAVVESVKAASDVYAPIGGSIAAVNEDWPTVPRRLTQTLTATAGLCALAPSDGVDESVLMTPDDYQQFIDELDD